MSGNGSHPASVSSLLLGFSSPGANADAIADFYKGHTVTIYIGYAPGGGYDLYGRLAARHIGRHILGSPTVVAQNMPGAGSLKLANFLYNVAPKNGSVLGVISQSTPQEEALGTSGVSYESNKFNWIGRITSNVELSVVWHTSKIQTVEDAKTREVTVAGTGPTSASVVYPKVLNGVAGTKFKVISGYGGSAEGVLAMERGETMGALLSWASLKSTRRSWLADKKVFVLVQYAPKRHGDLPDVPAMTELGSTPDERRILALYASGAEIGRAITAPPGVPPERVKALRKAFEDMIRDGDFLAEVKKRNIEFDPLTGEELQKVVSEAGSIPPSLVARARAVRE
ncbi:MAG: hypothetical protein GEU76_14390 [Alphaproteobacteria bacterium]|nr:hypothetical protein [Alphaproteobacteria bacterium]